MREIIKQNINEFTVDIIIRDYQDSLLNIQLFFEQLLVFEIIKFRIIINKQWLSEEAFLFINNLNSTHHSIEVYDHEPKRTCGFYINSLLNHIKSDYFCIGTFRTKYFQNHFNHLIMLLGENQKASVAFANRVHTQNNIRGLIVEELPYHILSFDLVDIDVEIAMFRSCNYVKCLTALTFFNGIPGGRGFDISYLLICSLAHGYWIRGSKATLELKNSLKESIESDWEIFSGSNLLENLFYNNEVIQNFRWQFGLSSQWTINGQRKTIKTSKNWYIVKIRLIRRYIVFNWIQFFFLRVFKKLTSNRFYNKNH